MNDSLINSIINNNHRELSRAISKIENDETIPHGFFDELYPHTLNATRIGITGPPGAGKSTIVDGLIQEYRSQNLSVGVVAVDPTSPFTGGALLGDRVRMNHFLLDEDVFIRSMGSRGDLGGLARKTQDVGDLLAASGKDIVVYETVGVGQGEYDVAKAVDLTVVVLVPESGDEIQLMKAGLLEIADFFVINKSDRDGSGRLTHLLKSMLYTSERNNKLEPPVIQTVATEQGGIFKLRQEIDKHLNQLEIASVVEEKRKRRHLNRIIEMVQKHLSDKFWTSDRQAELENIINNNDLGDISPFKAANKLINRGI